MGESLPALEKQCSEIQMKISGLGDMRSGSITTTGGRRGNPGCHCRKEGDAGHGPFYRLTRKVRGKTVTETFATPIALRKAQSEVAEFHRFRELSQDLLDVNEKICRARPVEDTLTPQEKKRRKRFRQKVEREVSVLLRLVSEDQRRTGRLDLEAVEMAMRAAMHRAGVPALSHLLRGDAPAPDEREVPCPRGQKARYREVRSRKVLTALGEIEFLRA